MIAIQSCTLNDRPFTERDDLDVWIDIQTGEMEFVESSFDDTSGILYRTYEQELPESTLQVVTMTTAPLGRQHGGWRWHDGSYTGLDPEFWDKQQYIKIRTPEIRLYDEYERLTEVVGGKLYDRRYCPDDLLNEVLSDTYSMQD